MCNENMSFSHEKCRFSMQYMPFQGLKISTLRCNMPHFRMQNTPFCTAKWRISQTFPRGFGKRSIVLRSVNISFRKNHGRFPHYTLQPFIQHGVTICYIMKAQTPFASHSFHSFTSFIFLLPLLPKVYGNNNNKNVFLQCMVCK